MAETKAGEAGKTTSTGEGPGDQPKPREGGEGGEGGNTGRKVSAAALEARIGQLEASIGGIPGQLEAHLARVTELVDRKLTVPTVELSATAEPLRERSSHSADYLADVASELTVFDAREVLRLVQNREEGARWASIGIHPETHVIAKREVVCTYDGKTRTTLIPGKPYEIGKFGKVKRGNEELSEHVIMLEKDHVRRPTSADLPADA